MTALHGNPGLRPFQAPDEEFSFQVYASTRAGEMALVQWNAEEKEAFLRMQFHAQRTHYTTYSPKAGWWVIMLDDAPVGRMVVDRSPDQQINLMDIALLPEYRGQGLGTQLMQDLLDEARTSGKAVRLHVERFNPAYRLYQRLGFEETGTQAGIYMEMLWKAVRE